MTVVVAHQVSPTGGLVLEHGAREAKLRGVQLVVVHVVESLDLDVEDANRSGLSEDVRMAVAASGSGGVTWDIQLVTGTDDIAGSVVRVANERDAQVLVIGARRRSPVGKLLLGSTAQSIILDADVPVLVVKADRSA
jgi:nucleotide-binding universal stress UspA family protein